MAETPSELKSEIEKLEARHADNPEGRFFVPLANAYRKTGEIDRAEELLRAGLRQHPDYLSAHIVLGRCLADRGAMAEATSEFEYVLSVDPQNLIALRTLGELAASAGRSGEAARWYEELLSVDPMNEDARRALDALPPAAATATEPGPVDLGHDEPEAATGPDAVDEVVTETIAELYARQGLHDRAAGVYRELVRRRGGDPALERRLEELEAMLGQGAPTAFATEEMPAAAPTVEEPTFEDAAVEEPVIGQPSYEEPRFEEPRFEEPSVEEPFPTLAGEAFDASFEHGFDELPTLGTEWLPGGGETPEEPLEEAVPEREVEPLAFAVATPEPTTIAELLGELVAWRPDGRAEPTPALAESLPAGFEDEPWAVLLSTEPEADPIPGLASAAAAEEERFPWELPELTEEPTAAEEAPVEELFSFDSFFAEAAPEPAPPEPTLPEPALPEQALPEPPRADASPAASQDEDDDLESFQAWLRSLKR